MTLIKQGVSLRDPHRESNMKHTTPNEIMNETKKHKAKVYKIPSTKTFMRYAEGQYETIFKTNDTRPMEPSDH